MIFPPTIMEKDPSRQSMILIQSSKIPLQLPQGSSPLCWLLPVFLLDSNLFYLESRKKKNLFVAPCLLHNQELFCTHCSESLPFCSHFTAIHLQ